jgi:hypothetical protein
MPGTALARRGGPSVYSSAAEFAFLLRLQGQGLRYFLDNQTRTGLVLDRQANHGPRRAHGLVSTAATGMGFIALALASAEPYRLITPAEAATRVRQGVDTALRRLPHTRGVLPHFVESATGAPLGIDVRSTVDTAWLVAGALWAAAFLHDRRVQADAAELAARVDWAYWTAANGLLAHGHDRGGRFLGGTWDRLNGETVFLYVLAAGAADRAWPAAGWSRLTAGHADLGLFVSQYGLDLLDLASWQRPGVDLRAEADAATAANYRACCERADEFATYGRYWGLSAGDGPGEGAEPLAYRCYAPAGPVDGTAHVTATAAALGVRPDLVWENLCQADRELDRPLRGRYGFSTVNCDRAWVGPDMVGIDAGAAVLALDNCLMDGRVRRVFHELPGVQAGLDRLGFVRSAGMGR